MTKCPFCGAAAEKKGRNRDIGAGDFRWLVTVRCSNTGCPVRPMVHEWGQSGYRQGDKQTNEEAEAKAVRRWETRA